MIVVQTRTSASPAANVIITLLEVALRHLAVADDEPGARQHPPELLGLGLDRLDPVVDEEHLAAAVELAQDRVADEPGRRLGDPGLDRQPVLRRRLDDRHVADAGEGQVQRPRDRRRGQGQDVDLAPELLQPLLRRDAEPLLLVDDDEARGPGTSRPSTAGGASRSRGRPSRPRARRSSASARPGRRTATAAGP